MDHHRKLREMVRLELKPLKTELLTVPAMEILTKESLMVAGASQSMAVRMINALDTFLIDNPKDGLSLHALKKNLRYVPNVGIKGLTYIIAVINAG